MNRNTIIITIVSIIAIFGFLSIAYVLTNTPQQKKVYSELKEIKKTDHVKWSKDKKNILVEYSDLQCPACKAYHEYFKSNIDNDKVITNNVTFVYRHFPLAQHQHSEEAAYAAEAAGKQGKFFEMSDLMFTNQPKWENEGNVKEIFEGYAKDLKLDLEKFRTDRDSKEVKDKVNQDLISGQQFNVDATPTFYLNGIKITDVASLDGFKRLLIKPGNITQ